MGRIVENNMPPEDLVVADAEFAIRTVADYTRAGGPGVWMAGPHSPPAVGEP
jgi:hypothetical protein